MSELTKIKCISCNRDAPQVTEDEIAVYKPQIPEWTILEHEGISRLERIFRFPDFSQAMSFTNRVGDLAEAEDHHPAILTEWGSVKITWWTHKIRGLHRNDFVAAAKTDQLI